MLDGIKRWIINFFSADEKKSSTLVILLLVFAGVSVWFLVKYQDLPQKLYDILVNLIMFLTGINVKDTLGDVASNIFGKKNESVSSEIIPATVTETPTINNTVSSSSVLDDAPL